MAIRRNASLINHIDAPDNIQPAPKHPPTLLVEQSKFSFFYPLV